MGIFTIHPISTFVFGLLGNIISLMVFLAPLPTFLQIRKKKSTEGFQSIPYIVSLFSAMLWLYYTFLKESDSFLLTINSMGCFVQTGYIIFYLIYAPKKARVLTVKLILLFNVFGFGAILLSTFFLAKGANRVHVLGWICDSFAVSVFAAPLCILRKVIRTKSVEYMPFFLSFFLTLSAVMWFGYGMLLKDYFVAVPNIVGFVFGVLQMILYVIYKKKKGAEVVEQQQRKVPELSEQIIDVVKLGAMVCSDMNPVTGIIDVKEQTEDDQNKKCMEVMSQV